MILDKENITMTTSTNTLKSPPYNQIHCLQPTTKKESLLVQFNDNYVTNFQHNNDNYNFLTDKKMNLGNKLSTIHNKRHRSAAEDENINLYTLTSKRIRLQRIKSEFDNQGELITSGNESKAENTAFAIKYKHLEEKKRENNLKIVHTNEVNRDDEAYLYRFKSNASLETLLSNQLSLKSCQPTFFVSNTANYSQSSIDSSSQEHIQEDPWEMINSQDFSRRIITNTQKTVTTQEYIPTPYLPKNENSLSSISSDLYQRTNTDELSNLDMDSSFVRNLEENYFGNNSINNSIASAAAKISIQKLHQIVEQIIEFLDSDII